MRAIPVQALQVVNGSMALRYAGQCGPGPLEMSVHVTREHAAPVQSLLAPRLQQLEASVRRGLSVKAQRCPYALASTAERTELLKDWGAPD